MLALSSDRKGSCAGYCDFYHELLLTMYHLTWEKYGTSKRSMDSEFIASSQILMLQCGRVHT